MTDGINGVIKGSSTAVNCFEKTLKDVADILGEKKPSDRQSSKPDPVKQSRDRMAEFKRANRGGLLQKAKKVKFPADLAEKKITRAKKRRN